MNPFIETITSQEPAVRNRAFLSICREFSPPALEKALLELDAFRQQTPNLYERVRASLFLAAGYRFVLAPAPELPEVGFLPFEGFGALLDRRFEETIQAFQTVAAREGLSGTIASGLAEAYHHLSFQILSDQVRKSVRASQGNQWMFRIGHADELPLRILPALLQLDAKYGLYPILQEQTSVRMDLSHSCWSDIFFLGMDYPEGAQVLNVSIDLGVFGRDKEIRPPISTYLRVIPEPVLRLTSVDLQASKDITELSDLFNFGNDYLSLLKAGVIASGLIPPAFEGSHQRLTRILTRLVGPGLGIELVTQVNDIPKGSRFAVSTNLLGSIIALLMRASGQTQALEGPLQETERRLVASRAILGEWLGGSGGGWQDSGGVWPGFKAIRGALAQEGDPEYGISRGCLLPQHQVLGEGSLHPEMEARLAQSLVLMHGGMAQNVGPILEMVTEKYLLRSESEWAARLQTQEIFNGILSALREGNVAELARQTTRNWDGPLKTIIPWASNHYTEALIKKAKKAFGADFWGFLMLGGMSGGGMGMFVNPEEYGQAKVQVLEILGETKKELERSMPFAMEPVVYNFQVNPRGSTATLLRENQALLTEKYYGLHLPDLVRMESESLTDQRRKEIDLYTRLSASGEKAYPILRTVIGNLFRVRDHAERDLLEQENQKVLKIKQENGFDPIQHEQLRQDMQKGRIGLARNRLSVDTIIEDVEDRDVHKWEQVKDPSLGTAALKAGKVAVVSLAGGVGSRWTQGAGVIKALNPFCEIADQHRSFLEIHLAKTRHKAQAYGVDIPHIVATSYLTHKPIQEKLLQSQTFGYDGSTYLSPGRSISQRFIPLERDLRFLWEEMPQETLDENKQKVQDAVREALIGWARSKGEGADYTDNLALQRLSPMGHWYELSNMFRNGTLARVLREHPQVETLMLHNIDTLGADVDERALAVHLARQQTLTFEVVPRWIEDRGGGLARVNGRLRLLEGLAQPREEDELRLSYYNTMTTWIQIDELLATYGLTRTDLEGPQEIIDEAVRNLARRMPTYVTIKNVKYRWGHGQEDIYPVAQVEKLWSDMSALNDLACGYLVVPRNRGQQLKEPAQLDAWVNDGSLAYIAKLCGWEASAN
ncbi:MAG: UTP--glucose-1-phosphate uridylyltransferase [Bacteroidota bacterium]